NIRLHGTTAAIEDYSNDICCDLQGGSNVLNRNFLLSLALTPGSYDVDWQIWMGEPDAGNLICSSGWQVDQLQVNSFNHGDTIAITTCGGYGLVQINPNGTANTIYRDGVYWA